MLYLVLLQFEKSCHPWAISRGNSGKQASKQIISFCNMMFVSQCHVFFTNTILEKCMRIIMLHLCCFYVIEYLLVISVFKVTCVILHTNKTPTLSGFGVMWSDILCFTDLLWGSFVFCSVFLPEASMFFHHLTSSLTVLTDIHLSQTISRIGNSSLLQKKKRRS